MKNKIRLIYILIILIIFSFPASVFAQTVASNCVVTKVGKPPADFVLPPECATGSLTLPPNLGAENSAHSGYFQMPSPTDNSYKFEASRCGDQHWGSKELISVLYTVAQRWKAKYPQGHINIGDLTARGHKTHKWGRAVDLDATTNGRDWVADMTKGNYNRDATIELGKMLVDTNHVLHIWYNDQAVNNAVLLYARQKNLTNQSSSESTPLGYDVVEKYARETGPTGMVMKPIVNHDNHFHLDVKQNPEKLAYWEPGC